MALTRLDIIVELQFICVNKNVFLFLAAGLYYLAELVEEYTVATGKIIRWITLVSIRSCSFRFSHIFSLEISLYILTVGLLNFILQITLFIYGCLFVFEDMTSTMVICGIVSQIVHLTLLQSFPFFALTSPQFILAAGKTDLNVYGKHNFRLLKSQYLNSLY